MIKLELDATRNQLLDPTVKERDPSLRISYMEAKSYTDFKSLDTATKLCCKKFKSNDFLVN